MTTRLLLIASLALSGCFAADPSLATGLAEAGAALAAKGKTEAATSMLYRALANDENCGVALYELGRLSEASGDKSTATVFYTKVLSCVLDDKRSADLEKRLSRLNPLALKLRDSIREYASAIKIVSKKYPDVATTAAAASCLDGVSRMNIIPQTTKLFDLKSEIVGLWKMSDTAQLTFRPDGVMKFMAGGRESSGTWSIVNDEVVATMSWVNKYKLANHDSLFATNCSLTGVRIKESPNGKR